MIDANFNRAREALRVMEDAARFALGDEALTRELKGVRHALRDALGALPIDGAALLANRDTPGDVGTRVSTRAEGERAGLRDVALAAGKRAGEALRVIEECAKALTGAATAESTSESGTALAELAAHSRFEALRYRLYDAEKRLGLALAGGRAAQWRVCVILTEALCARPWTDVAREAIDAGADCVQLREKSLSDRELLARASALVSVARDAALAGGAGRARASVIVNDRPDIALLSGADGVHLGQGDLPVGAVRRIAGERLLIGVSASDMEQARAALRDGADYCGVGAMFATATKRKDSIAGPGLMRAYAEHAPALPPHLAIGGVTAQNAGEVAAAGARGVAVCSAVCAAANPGEAVRELVRAMERAAR